MKSDLVNVKRLWQIPLVHRRSSPVCCQPSMAGRRCFSRKSPKYQTTHTKSAKLQIKWKDYFLTIFCGKYHRNIVYNRLISPDRTSVIRDMAKGAVPPSAGENAITIQVILLVLEVAVADEIIFRLGIQSLLVKYLKLEGQLYWIAILVTSVL